MDWDTLGSTRYRTRTTAKTDRDHIVLKRGALRRPALWVKRAWATMAAMITRSAAYGHRAVSTTRSVMEPMQLEGKIRFSRFRLTMLSAYSQPVKSAREDRKGGLMREGRDG
jgi:hypothetical protein